MNPFICLNPFNSGEWWEMSGNSRRLVPAAQRSFLQFIGAPAPAPLDAGWFLSYPVAHG